MLRYKWLELKAFLLLWRFRVLHRWDSDRQYQAAMQGSIAKMYRDQERRRRGERWKSAS